jgi:hypothetical protein
MKKFSRLTARVQHDLDLLGQDLAHARSLQPEQLQEIRSSVKAAEELLNKLTEVKTALGSPAGSSAPGFFSAIFGVKPEPAKIANTDHYQSLEQDIKSQKEAILLAEEPAITTDQRLIDTELTTSDRQESDQTQSATKTTLADTSSNTHPPGLPITWAVYDVLAYDPTTTRFATSSTYGPVPADETKLSFSEVLTRLRQPALFLQQLTALRTGKVAAVAASANAVIIRRDVERRVGASVLPLAPGDVPPEPPAELAQALRAASAEGPPAGGPTPGGPSAGHRGRGWREGGRGKRFVRRTLKGLAVGVVLTASTLYLFGVIAGILKEDRERRTRREAMQRWRDMRNRKAAERRERRRRARKEREDKEVR